MIILFSGSSLWLFPSVASHAHFAQQASLSAFGALLPNAASQPHAAASAALSIQGVLEGNACLHAHKAGLASVVFAEFITPDLIVETGAVVPGADSFISLADANNYWRLVRSFAWTSYTEEQRKAALRSAAEYLGYAYDWKGKPESESQPLAWPRKECDGIAPLTVPQRVITAQLYLADIAATETLGLMEDDGRQVVSVTERLDGVGSTQTTYGGVESKALNVKRYPRVEALLSGLIIGPVGTAGVGISIMVRQ